MGNLGPEAARIDRQIDELNPAHPSFEDNKRRIGTIIQSANEAGDLEAHELTELTEKFHRKIGQVADQVLQEA